MNGLEEVAQHVNLTGFYVAVGILFISNLGTLVGLWIASIKLTAKLTEKFTRLEGGVASNRKDINAAHEKIRDQKSWLMEMIKSKS